MLTKQVSSNRYHITAYKSLKEHVWRSHNTVMTRPDGHALRLLYAVSQDVHNVS